jgi:hypothetical protein
MDRGHRRMQHTLVARGWALCGFAALILLGACREDRDVVFYEPHVYKGQAEPELSQGTVKELEARAQQGARL